MELGLSGRRAAVMAGSSGLGKGVAARLAAEGASVVVCGRDERRLGEARAEIAAGARDGARIEAIVADLADAAGPAALVDHAVGAFGGLDILVTNAGGPPAGLLAEFDDDAWQAAFDGVVMSAARGVRAALPHLRASDQAAIVCIASSSVKVPLPLLGLSNALRPALHGMVKTWADELGRDGIRVNLVAPGRVDTARIRYLDAARAEASGRSPEEIRREVERSVPLGRYGTPEELGELVAFLCSGAARYITGTATLFDGGLTRAL